MTTDKPARMNNKFIVLMLGALITVSPFSIDMYLPAFSQIANDLATSPAKISLSLASYFIGFALGQLLYGPLLDRFGRKKPLYYGLALYIIASIGCVQSQTLAQLVAFRFVQALGGCVPFVAAIAMVRDFFPVRESAKILSILMLMLGLSPLLAPTAGGFIVAGLGWQWIFIVMAIMVFIILIITFIYLPEGHQPDRSVSLKFKPILIDYSSILKTPQFHTYALSGAFSFATMFVYVAGSPLIFMEIFRVSPQTYGGIFALLSVGFIGGNQLNILILRKYKSEQIFRLALWFQVITSIVFLVGALNNWYGLIATIILFFILLSCLGLTYPNASAVALEPFSRNAGSASAMVGFLQIGVAGLASVCVGLFNANNSVPIVAMMVGTSLIALLIIIVDRKKLAMRLS